MTDMAELRSFIFIDQLQPRTMCYLGTWIRGSLPRSNMAAQVIEVAPGLDIEEWVQGGEKTLEKGTVYVVEFWATWCGPCRKSIPHLSKLNDEYGDDGLVIIGVSDEEPDTVRNFVKGQGKKLVGIGAGISRSEIGQEERRNRDDDPVAIAEHGLKQSPPFDPLFEKPPIKSQAAIPIQPIPDLSQQSL